uniref:Glutaredoxin domain-containing protein n=1 Tax=viral metagenome TaxID=1070528 RepID=A0A6C0ER17_9ZZZZ
MNFEDPCNKGFTIYSKSGCHNCKKAKNILSELKIKYNVIECDEYLIENKEEFLLFMNNKSGTECKQFPIIFNDGLFVGGFIEFKKYIDTFFIDNCFE